MFEYALPTEAISLALWPVFAVDTRAEVSIAEIFAIAAFDLATSASYRINY